MAREPRAAKHVNRPYKIVPYDVSWPILYESNAKVLREVFGNQILMVEHIGSTSIPGMWAKPQIDILITVKDFDKVPEFYDAMKAHNYTPRGDWTGSIGEEYFTKDNDKGEREISLHVLPSNHQWASGLVDLRDYLRANPKEMELYLNTKKDVYKQYPDDYTNYFKKKRRTVLMLEKRAVKWRKKQFDLLK